MSEEGRGAAFGDLLRRHREAAGLSQEALAARSGISADAIGLLERGQRRRPRADTIRRLATALGLDEDGRTTLEASVDEAPSAPEGGRRPPLAILAAVAGVVVLVAALLTGVVLTRSRGPQHGGPPRAQAVSATPSPSEAVAAQTTPYPTSTGGTPVPGVSAVAPSSQPSVGPSGALLCRLPIDRGGSGAFAPITADGAQGGVVHLAQLTADPAGSPRLPDGESAVNVTYSWELGRWLPVRPEWVAPDHRRYAFSDRVGQLHVVDAGSGEDRIVNGDRSWAVIAYQAEGIYAGVGSATGQSAGLWLIDPAAGGARQLQAAGDWQGVADGAAWSLEVTAPAVSPSPAPQGIVYGNTVRRLDLRTGQTTTMYQRQDVEFRFVGLDDAGDAYVTPVSGLVAPLVEIVAVGRTIDLAADAWVNVEVDGDRLWFGGNFSAAVYLKDSAGMRAMQSLGYGQIRIAGACR
jgi:transcriptional regulator with XRE-family HTH domain